MKRWPVFVFVALLACVAAFTLTHRHMRQTAPDELTWLRNEFALTPEQFAAVAKLHDAYAPVCADHCFRIAQAADRLRAARANPNTPAAELAAAEAAWQAVCDECTTATRRHLEEIAAQMSPDQGKRYLELVGPKLTQRDHSQPFGLK